MQTSLTHNYVIILGLQWLFGIMRDMVVGLGTMCIVCLLRVPNNNKKNQKKKKEKRKEKKEC